jgi:hypothetical protein
VTGLEFPFVTAAVTDKLVDFATNVIGDLGYAGIFVLMTLESRSRARRRCCSPGSRSTTAR